MGINIVTVFKVRENPTFFNLSREISCKNITLTCAQLLFHFHLMQSKDILYICNNALRTEQGDSVSTVQTSQAV